MAAGRTPIITEDMVADAAAVAQTSTRNAAIWLHLGVHEATFYGWKARGKSEAQRLADDDDAQPDPGEELYVEFFEAVTRGREKMQHRLEASVFGAALRDGKLALDVLARIDRAQWGRRGTGADGDPVRVEVSGPNGGPVEVSEQARRGIEAAGEIISLQQSLIDRVTGD